jgi:asparagine synthase (glutamine-hydrolysing)
MCGIVGILARGESLVPGLLERATASLAHRGPDDSGTIVLHARASEPLDIGLGHRRLAILDLSPLGHQPMHDPATGNWIVFNGEIYNFREIRQELEKEGHVFQSRSDTEVLLKAYSRWGEECLSRLRGMFAFAIWDSAKSRIFLARDPMGVKPLYYCSAGTHLLFASEIRTLLGTGLVPRKLDHAALLQYLSFGSVYDPNTAIESIHSLRAGHFLTWEDGKVRETCYWNPPPQAIARGSREELEREIRQMLEESIQMQTVSDVPVGVFLSGGIDSSAIVAMLSRKQRPSTFSVVFREADYSEAEYSRAVAQRFQTDHHEMFLSAAEALAAAPAAISAMDQPTIDGLNTYIISKAAREAGVKVVLSGLGGDELFAGYSNFRAVPRMENFLRYWKHLPGHQALGAALFAGQSSSDRTHKLRALATANGRLVHPYFLSRMLFAPAQLGALVRSQNGWLRAHAPLQEALDRTGQMDAINRVSYLETRCYMLNTLLRDSDVMSMAHGLEIRVPLIDQTLATGLLSIPGRRKLIGRTPKPLLVGAVRGELPDEIICRRKRGFTLPFEHWLKHEMRQAVEQSIYAITEGPLGAVLDPGAVKRVWKDFLEGHTSWSRPWSLHVLERWCHQNCLSA